MYVCGETGSGQVAIWIIKQIFTRQEAVSGSSLRHAIKLKKSVLKQT